jgi:hypothetical protein
LNRLCESLIVGAALLWCSGASLAQMQSVSDAEDLTAVIALNGKPCGKVRNATKRAEDDYVATCEDGNRYRVYARDGRVIVEKIT